MGSVEFTKVQGTGNDFVFVDARERNREVLEPQVVSALCDRHFGIGADGLLALVSVKEGVPRMRIYNADGSIAQMCGNGLRCFAKVLSDRLGFFENPLPVDTDAGRKMCHLSRNGDITNVRIEMGPVTIEPPVGRDKLGICSSQVLRRIEGTDVLVYPVSTGNPHAVLIGSFSRPEMEQLGPVLSTHPFFPEGTNVEFLEPISSDTLRLTVYERGVGFTLACGTGAVASTAVAASLGLAHTGAPVTVHLPGGILHVTIEPGFEVTWLEGPAVEVFSGTILVARATPASTS